jgi:glucose-6-phosphate isomerase
LTGNSGMTLDDPLKQLQSALDHPAHRQALQQEREQFHALDLRTLFAQEPARFQTFCTRAGDLLLDYSKTHLREPTLQKLLDLARASGLPEAREALFSGARINHTEGRAALHTLLRGTRQEQHPAQAAEVAHCLQRQDRFARAILDDTWRGHTGMPIRRIVHIGIGGSDLGPAMAVHALSHFHLQPRREFNFVSNIDPTAMDQVLQQADPQTTLFIVASKTFTTLETLENARQARAWLVNALGEHAVARHFVAISTNLEAISAFGIDPDNAFPLWDWVGGRYSIWSAIALPLILAIGPAGFRDFLRGGALLDAHFLEADLRHNLPVILALLGIWYSHFFDTRSQALICYDQYLHLFPAYLQQLDMESNGKGCHRDGSPIAGPTAVPLWGGTGSNTQHSFHQLFHQGQIIVPVEFLVARHSLNPRGEMHDMLYVNCLAQSRALMMGRTLAECVQELCERGMDPDRAQALAPHLVMPGNRPSTTLVYPRLTPSVLGQLIALYEHRVFCQSVIWNINAFDQWGVELGKQISRQLLAVLQGQPGQTALDSSTAGLLAL